jgi:hypothetical protein
LAASLSTDYEWSVFPRVFVRNRCPHEKSKVSAGSEAKPHIFKLGFGSKQGNLKERATEAQIREKF